jgi:eukaryotic-like serine/threonine-protein kinase
MNGEKKQADIAFQMGQHIGQYQVMSILDRGRFAGAYVCQHIHQHSQVIVEVLRPPLVGDLQEDFLAQTKTLMALDHPQILRLQDAGIDAHYPFLVTDYLPQHLILHEVYPEGKPHPLAKILPYLKQVASALHYAHERNVLHGDLHLENILLNRNNQILLWSFTIAAIKQNRERLQYQKSSDMRNIAYAAPERIQGKALPASDQYSLAVIVYELLCGTLPFIGSYIEIANQHVHTPPASMRQRVPGISTQVESIVMRALAKDAQQRYSTIQAFVDALEQELQIRSIDAPASKTVPPAQPTSVIAPPAIQAKPVKPSVFPKNVPSSPIPPVQAPAFSNKPPPSSQMLSPLPLPPPAPVVMAIQRSGSPPPISPSVAAMQAAPTPVESAPAAPRRDNNDTMTRRVFAAGLVGLATLGGAGGWYLLSKRLTVPSPPAVAADDVPPVTPTSVNNQSALIFVGHLAAVNAVVWSPDGKLIASASDDKFVQVFDESTGKRMLIYSGHTEEVATVAWSPNGKLIASGSQDGTVQVWGAADGKRVITYKGHQDRVNAVSWSKEGQMLASGSEDKTVQVWNAISGVLAFNFLGHTAGVLCVGWQPDSSSVASGSWDGTLRDWATVQHGDHFNVGDQIFNYGGHGKDEVYALTWSPDGNFIASAGADQTVQISSGSDGTPKKPFFTGHQSKQHVNPVRSVAWSPDGNLIASGDTDGNVYVWWVVGRKTVFIYRGHKKAVNALAWSPDGKKIASASADNTVHVWHPIG